MKIAKIVEYVKKSFHLISKDYPNTNEQILKSALVYQCLYRHYFKINLPLNQIIRIENSMGLIGPDNSSLTKFLQNTLGWSDLIKTRAILHDSCGRFFIRHGKGQGYIYYCKSVLSSDRDKRNCYKGQINGILFCLFNFIRI